METVLQLNAAELNANFFKRLLLFLGNDSDAEITISYKSAHPRVLQKETRKEYAENLNQAIENIERNRNIVTLSGEEFRFLTKKPKNYTRTPPCVQSEQ